MQDHLVELSYNRYYVSSLALKLCGAETCSITLLAIATATQAIALLTQWVMVHTLANITRYLQATTDLYIRIQLEKNKVNWF